MIGMVAIVLLLIAGLLLTGSIPYSYLSVPLPCLNAVTIYDCNGTAYYTTNTVYFNATFHINGTSYDNGTIYANGSYYNNCTQYYGSDTSASEGSAFSSFGSSAPFSLRSPGQAPGSPRPENGVKSWSILCLAEYIGV